MSTKRFARLIVTAAATAGAAVTLLAPAGIANADSCSGKSTTNPFLGVKEFSIQDIGDGNSLVTVDATAYMPAADADRFATGNNNGRPTFELWGNGRITSWTPEHIWVDQSGPGLGLRGAQVVGNDRLDRFDGPDQLFANVAIFDWRNNVMSNVATCTLVVNP